MIQTDLFAADVQPLFEEHRRDWLVLARATARMLLTFHPEITIDNIREVCPPPADVDPRVMGAVFRTADFEACGYVKSHRRTCHNRPVAKFRRAGA